MRNFGEIALYKCLLSALRGEVREIGEGQLWT
jgi:hypothetical protein